MTIDTEICGSLLALAVIAFLISVPFFRAYTDRKRIQTVLEREGAKNIVIEWLPFRLVRNYKLTYIVTYDTRWGKRRERKCQTWWGDWVLDLFGERRIRWKDED